jgi:hypothetical protein
MFETIVWATDGSEAAAHALPYVQGLAEVHGAVVRALPRARRVAAAGGRTRRRARVRSGGRLKRGIMQALVHHAAAREEVTIGV